MIWTSLFELWAPTLALGVTNGKCYTDAKNTPSNTIECYAGCQFHHYDFTGLMGSCPEPARFKTAKPGFAECYKDNMISSFEPNVTCYCNWDYCNTRSQLETQIRASSLPAIFSLVPLAIPLILQ